MQTGKIYQNAVGFVFDVETDIDLSSADLCILYVTKPSGTQTMWTGSMKPTDTSVIRYTSILGDLPEVGTYKGYAGARIGGNMFYGEPFSFKVFARGT